MGCLIIHLAAVRQHHAQFLYAALVRHLDLVGRLGARQDHPVREEPDRLQSLDGDLSA